MGGYSAHALAADTVVLQLSAAEQWLQRTASVMKESAGSGLQTG